MAGIRFLGAIRGQAFNDITNSVADQLVSAGELKDAALPLSVSLYLGQSHLDEAHEWIMGVPRVLDSWVNQLTAVVKLGNQDKYS